MDNRTPRAGAKLAAPLLVIAAIAVVIVFDPFGSLVGRVDLSWVSLPDLPETPGWLRFLIGPGKLIVLGVIVVLVWAGESERRRRSAADDGDGGR